MQEITLQEFMRLADRLATAWKTFAVQLNHYEHTTTPQHGSVYTPAEIEQTQRVFTPQFCDFVRMEAAMTILHGMYRLRRD